MSLNGMPVPPASGMSSSGLNLMHDMMNPEQSNHSMGGVPQQMPMHTLFASPQPMLNVPLSQPQPPGVAGFSAPQSVPSNPSPGSQLPPPTTRPTSADACHSIVHSLMCHRQGGETESFSKRAIESLVKKLKEKRDELDSLIIAITTNGSQTTKCVTIQRTLDGRLQVAGRKGFPHVIYAKIWRWPDLHKNELKHIKTCQFAFELKNDFVCVNPYHYERLIPAGIDLSSLSLQSLEEDIAHGGVSAMNNDQFLMHRANSPNIVQHHPQEAPDKMAYPIMPNNSHYNHESMNHMKESGRQPAEDNFTNLSIKTDFVDVHRDSNNEQNAANSEGHSQDPKWSNMPSFSNDSKNEDQNRNNNEQWNSPSSSSSQILANRTNNLSISRPLLNQPLPEYWCSISYFELDQQCGGAFKVPSTFTSVSIDGYVDPYSGNRFCLGALGNVHRSEKSEKTRLHIGKGIKLDFRGEGDVFLNCLSEHSVFLQSYYLDREAGRQPGDAIHKIYPQTYIKVFDLKQCYGQMQSQVRDAHSNASSSSALAYPNKSSGMAVDDLRRLCILRLSFIKGWGPDYPRKTIKSTPCWIEITLHRAMQLLDLVLHNYPLKDSP